MDRKGRAADGAGTEVAEGLRGTLGRAVQQLVDLVRFLTKSFVDEPDQVEVTGTEDDSRVDLEIKVAQDDIGKVIGRQGRTIRAIRTVAKAASVKVGKRVSVEVQD